MNYDINKLLEMYNSSNLDGGRNYRVKDIAKELGISESSVYRGLRKAEAQGESVFRRGYRQPRKTLETISSSGSYSNNVVNINCGNYALEERVEYMPENVVEMPIPERRERGFFSRVGDYALKAAAGIALACTLVSCATNGAYSLKDKPEGMPQKEYFEMTYQREQQDKANGVGMTAKQRVEYERIQQINQASKEKWSNPQDIKVVQDRRAQQRYYEELWQKELEARAKNGIVTASSNYSNNGRNIDRNVDASPMNKDYSVFRASVEKKAPSSAVQSVGETKRDKPKLGFSEDVPNGFTSTYVHANGDAEVKTYVGNSKKPTSTRVIVANPQELKARVFYSVPDSKGAEGLTTFSHSSSNSGKVINVKVPKVSKEKKSKWKHDSDKKGAERLRDKK